MVLAHLQEPVEYPALGLAGDEPGTELAQHREVEAGVSQFQAEGVFPSDPLPNGGRGLAVGQSLNKLQHAHQCQLPR